MRSADEKCEALPPSLPRARSYLGGDEQEDERMTRARTAHPSGPGHICVPRAASACSLTAFPPANRPTLLIKPSLGSRRRRRRCASSFVVVVVGERESARARLNETGDTGRSPGQNVKPHCRKSQGPQCSVMWHVAGHSAAPSAIAAVSSHCESAPPARTGEDSPFDSWKIPRLQPLYYSTPTFSVDDRSTG